MIILQEGETTEIPSLREGLPKLKRKGFEQKTQSAKSIAQSIKSKEKNSP
jgi:hypothetical protein